MIEFILSWEFFTGMFVGAPIGVFLLLNFLKLTPWL